MINNKFKINLTAYIFISPFFILFLIFFVGPILYSFYMSFTDWTGMNYNFHGLKNYERLFSRDRLFEKALCNSLWLSILSVIIIMPLSLILASLLNIEGLKLRNIFRERQTETKPILSGKHQNVELMLYYTVLLAY